MTMAIELLKNNQFVPGFDRPNAPNIAVIFLHAYSDNFQTSSLVAAQAQGRGILMFA